jgi:hypothetical protein
MLAITGMTANLVIESQGRSLNLASNTFGKLLWVARSHGWQPEKAPEQWSNARWETEVMFPVIDTYLDGTVSRSDARELGKALKRILTSGDSGMSSSMYLALLMLLRVANQGAFAVHAEGHAPNLVSAGRSLAHA